MLWRAILLCVLLPTASAHAQTKAEIEAHYSKSYNRCVNGTGDFAMQGTGYGNLDCAIGEMLRLDGKLNAHYARTLARLAPDGKVALRQSQRAWLRVRNRKCNSLEAARALRDPTDESADPWCVMDETIRQTIWLKRRR